MKRPQADRVPFPLVHVLWRDAEADPAWCTGLQQLAVGTAKTQAHPNQTIGWLVFQDATWIIVAGTMAFDADDLSEPSFTNIIRIPAGMVINVEKY